MTKPFDEKTWVADWNSHSIERIMSHYADNAVLRSSGTPEEVRGKPAVRSATEGILKGMPDFKGSLKSFVRSGDRIAALGHMEGTNTGPFEFAPGVVVPPTRKRLSYDVAIFARLDDTGKIVDETDVFDVAELMGQLGVDPSKLGQKAS